ncbi:hypothetical protein TWF281_000042 [Arthrobotrys megalospora]
MDPRSETPPTSTVDGKDPAGLASLPPPPSLRVPISAAPASNTAPDSSNKVASLGELDDQQWIEHIESEFRKLDEMFAKLFGTAQRDIEIIKTLQGEKAAMEANIRELRLDLVKANLEVTNLQRSLADR